MPYHVYFLTNAHHTVLYTGVTGHLERRIHEHRQRLVKGLTARYNATKLVYTEAFPTAAEAIAREKTIKGWSRDRKNALVAQANPERCDWFNPDGPAGDPSLRSG